MKKHWPPFNFSAGPALLPKDVMEIAQKEFTDWHGTGLSVMDFSHRGKDFMSIAEKTEADFRQLLAIPSHYKVLFCAGGASFQFATVAMNLLRRNAVYVDTGIWGKKAIEEAERIGSVHRVDALIQNHGLLDIAPEQSWDLPDQYDYLHYTPNETIDGLEFKNTPTTGRGQLIADMSSNILSRPINIEDYALIYAGAQKNIGPAGLTIVIIREDLLEAELPRYVPTLMQYKVLGANDSMYNTPPTFSWYLAGLVFDWLLRSGGVAEMQARANLRSTKLYQFIDSNDFYANPIHPNARSRMNIPFTLADESLNDSFLKLAQQNGLAYLKGHRSVGGMRASLYNAMPMDGVDALVDFMGYFAEHRT